MVSVRTSSRGKCDFAHAAKATYIGLFRSGSLIIARNLEPVSDNRLVRFLANVRQMCDFWQMRICQAGRLQVTSVLLPVGD